MRIQTKKPITEPSAVTPPLTATIVESTDVTTGLGSLTCPHVNNGEERTADGSACGRRPAVVQPILSAAGRPRRGVAPSPTGTACDSLGAVRGAHHSRWIA